MTVHSGMARSPAYPVKIRRGSVTVTIYRTVNRGGALYCVSYVTAAAGRVRRNFADPDEARREAENNAQLLAAGDLQALKLTGEDRAAYLAAESALAETGVSLVTAANHFAEAWRILGRDAVVEAARHFRARVDENIPELTVAEAVEKFIADKEGHGISPHYRRDLRTILGRHLAGAFRCLLSTVSPGDLRDYLGRQGGGPVYKNGHRRVIVAFFNHAKAVGWLPKMEPTAAEALDVRKVKRRDVEIYAPKEVQALLDHAMPDFRPWLALIAFGGVRHNELRKGLRWDAIEWKTGTLIVPAAIAKTARKRLVKMQANLLAWLKPFQSASGAILDADPAPFIRHAAAASGVPWKVNALRHSFGSYRVAATGNAGQVSLEMGNSAAVVLRHYHEIIRRPADVKAYWAIKPPAAEQLVRTTSTARNS